MRPVGVAVRVSHTWRHSRRNRLTEPKSLDLQYESRMHPLYTNTTGILAKLLTRCMDSEGSSVGVDGGAWKGAVLACTFGSAARRRRESPSSKLSESPTLSSQVCSIKLD